VYYVLVAGTGETSRANIEALMEDYYYAKGDGGALVLAYKDAPSRSQIYAAQYAVDCKKEVVVFCREDAKTSGIPGASITFSAFPYVEATAFLENQDAIAHLLWSPDDTDLVEECVNKGIAAYNLCDGLVPLSVPEKKAVEPKPVEEPKAPKEVAQHADPFKTDLLKTIQGIQSMLDLLVKKING
jgi:hypothetical protein